MKDTEIARRGLLVVGCGKMGSAMLEGWLSRGLPPEAVWVRDPQPSDWLSEQGVHLNDGLPDDPAVALLAVKPQTMRDALPALATFAGGNTLFLSIAAGVSLATYEGMLGESSPIVRAMPNTPSAIGRGITAIVGNVPATDTDLDTAELLLSSVGEVVRLEDEAQIDAVTGVSGSGPAYVFHMIECLAAAGEAEGLSRDLALQLARATVAGAGALAQETGTAPGTLRENVTSPNGTTAAGLSVLMDEEAGLPPLIRRTVGAAADRARELGRDG
ncbi:pyrroline-5-carboxylate reductase [Roseivivax marinus]|uniref:pyrroline-5-carboxylate reductase n=1 Tax=Roseivivax marinus TaxID=1379903 RepID=UPI001F0340B8|nr:pyrroline-5-carboxylate reductase [Roseivivax marinus]UMA65265.1 pyrroline-5-carboxylate reductase [Roseivivax marinus]